MQQQQNSSSMVDLFNYQHNETRGPKEIVRDIYAAVLIVALRDLAATGKSKRKHSAEFFRSQEYSTICDIVGINKKAVNKFASEVFSARGARRAEFLHLLADGDNPNIGSEEQYNAAED